MLGAAYQAKHSLSGKSYTEVIADVHHPRKVCDPYPDAPEIYHSMVARYRTIIKELLEEHN